MTDDDITLVQASFAQVRPIAPQAAALFYGRLFEIEPEVRPLFHADLAEQGSKLMATLSVVVASLRDLPALLPAAQGLARRHVTYGVKDDYYAPVGAALIWTLEQGLGPDFTEQTRQAWVKAYTLLSGVMIAAATIARNEATG